eukprot:scaffold117045_cov32-Tisochrysis_lutea.AAC.4
MPFKNLLFRPSLEEGIDVKVEIIPPILSHPKLFFLGERHKRPNIEENVLHYADVVKQVGQELACCQPLLRVCAPRIGPSSRPPSGTGFFNIVPGERCSLCMGAHATKQLASVLAFRSLPSPHAST